MKLRGLLQNVTRTEKGALLIFDTRGNADALADYIAQEVTLNIKAGKDRTLSQNSLLWAIIGEIDRKQNGRRSEDGSTTIYAQLIKMARIKSDFLMVLEEALPSLKKAFRVVVERGKRNFNGNEMTVYECFLGSSSFSTKEMSDLIETALDYAERAGIDTAYYRDEWRGLIEREGENEHAQ